MNAVLFRAPNAPLTLEERAIPSLNDGDVLLKIDLCGVCASDLMAIDGVVTDYSPPVVLGHEIAARVVESRDPRFKLDTITSVNPMISCGVCSYCRRGEHKYCPKLYGIGHDIDGGFAEYMIVPKPLAEADGLLVVPNGIPAERLMFVEPLGCVLNAVHETRFRESVVVLGAGTIGLLFTQLLAERGLQTVVVEPMAHRREQAQSFGATLTVEPTEAGYDALREATDGGADTVIVATDHEAAIQDAFKSVRRGGVINFFGLAPAGRMLEMELEQLHYQGYTILASWAFSRKSLAEARDRIADGKIDLSPMITQRFALKDANEAIRYARDRKGVKAVFDPSLG
ncbi:MAG: alcohol dehydrogenase catalytic domain-containing protein [Candidatus Poribacteria bacterium]|nr:alcohol dehydrogenase catalytic domain-containing protein [Candidatus Poribacteria bacterium]